VLRFSKSDVRTISSFNKFDETQPSLRNILKLKFVLSSNAPS